MVEAPAKYKIVVDYDRSLAQMIQDGNYDSVHDSIIAEHFPVSGEGRHTISVVLLHFSRAMTFDKVLVEMNKQGYRPATIEKLLALGKAHPDLQRKFQIVALDSFWENLYGSYRAPCLHGCVDSRRLCLGWFGDVWDTNDRFLAVRK